MGCSNSSETISTTKRVKLYSNEANDEIIHINSGINFNFYDYDCTYSLTHSDPIISEIINPLIKSYRIIHKIEDNFSYKKFKVINTDDNNIYIMITIPLVFDINKLKLDVIKGLKYKYLVKLVHYFQDDFFMYIITENLGCNLYEGIFHYNTFTKEKLQYVLFQIINGLIYLFKNGYCITRFNFKKILLYNDFKIKINFFDVEEDIIINDKTIHIINNDNTSKFIDDHFLSKSDIMGCLAKMLLTILNLDENNKIEYFNYDNDDNETINDFYLNDFYGKIKNNLIQNNKDIIEVIEYLLNKNNTLEGILTLSYFLNKNKNQKIQNEIELIRRRRFSRESSGSFHAPEFNENPMSQENEEKEENEIKLCSNFNFYHFFSSYNFFNSSFHYLNFYINSNANEEYYRDIFYSFSDLNNKGEVLIDNLISNIKMHMKNRYNSFEMYQLGKHILSIKLSMCNIQQFIKILNTYENVSSKRKLKKAFNFFDEKNKGVISSNIIKEMFTNYFDNNLNSEKEEKDNKFYLDKIDELIKEIDNENLNLVSFNEYIYILDNLFV